ncbi:hypothetical protein GOBAR_DD22522 [Gossypium barbadense]|nr:hypothetical protein GOBAR_DD22522 [Gossypium barbadense]
MHRIGQVDDENNDHNDVHDKCLVVCRTLNIQMRDDFDNQMTNIFHSRCFIKFFLPLSYIGGEIRAV